MQSGRSIWRGDRFLSTGEACLAPTPIRIRFTPKYFFRETNPLLQARARHRVVFLEKAIGFDFSLDLFFGISGMKPPNLVFRSSTQALNPRSNLAFPAFVPLSQAWAKNEWNSTRGAR